jgi:hypothetical protein
VDGVDPDRPDRRHPDARRRHDRMDGLHPRPAAEPHDGARRRDGRVDRVDADADAHERPDRSRPAVGTVSWTGSTPTLVLQSDRTVTPGAATVTWSGSTPGITGASTLTLTPRGGGDRLGGLDTHRRPGPEPHPRRRDGRVDREHARDHRRQHPDAHPGRRHRRLGWQHPEHHRRERPHPHAGRRNGRLDGLDTGRHGRRGPHAHARAPAPSPGPGRRRHSRPSPTSSRPIEIPGGGRWEGEEDTTEVEVRNLTLHPRVALVRWTGSRPTVDIRLAPLRVRLPRLRRREPPAPAPVPAGPVVIDRTVQPGAADRRLGGRRTPAHQPQLRARRSASTGRSHASRSSSVNAKKTSPFSSP